MGVLALQVLLFLQQLPVVVLAHVHQLLVPGLYFWRDHVAEDEALRDLGLRLLRQKRNKPRSEFRVKLLLAVSVSSG